MEDTLRELRTISILDVKKFGLNPYSNGRYSLRLFHLKRFKLWSTSLNPYSNGRYSLRVS